ncbi:MAG: DUF4412 domain-containing protein [Nibricoccus sp.]
MKSPLLFLRVAGVCVLSAISAHVASAFEGKVDMQMTGGKNDTPMPMTYYIKGAHMRVEMAGQSSKRNKDEKVSVIMNMETQESIMLMESEKMYMVHKLNPGNEKAEAKGDQIDFKPTGRKEKIAGVEAEEYVGVSGKKRTELWVTKEMGKFMMANQGGPGARKQKPDAWAKFAEQGDFFVLRMIQRSKENGPEEMRMEVTKVEKGAQPDSLFQPPADYKKFEMPSMGDMMKGMIPGR